MSTWIDGRAASAEDLRALALVNYGHFTTMQVRARAVQGLDLHLQRLRDATRELFGRDLDADRVREGARRALALQDVADCTLRVTVFARDFNVRDAAAPAGAIDVLVSIAPPAAAGSGALRIGSYRHLRALPQIKHVGTFALFHHQRLATQAGYDDALFVAPDGMVCEGSVWNIGFWDGDAVVWPEAPALRGVTERLLQAGLAEAGVPQRTQVVRLSALSGFITAFAANTRGVQGIAAIDGVEFAGDDRCLHLLQDTLARCPWQAI